MSAAMSKSLLDEVVGIIVTNSIGGTDDFPSVNLAGVIGDLSELAPSSSASGLRVTEALTWYGERATSLASRLNGQSLDAMSSVDLTYLTAVLTELSLDAGRRASQALRETQ